ncbi:MAG: hypothetical protein ACFFED_17375 [Candidatus Thorarchaeota archaeon]
MSDRRTRVLESLGYDINSNHARILKAILLSQDELGAGITFDVLEVKLRELTGGKGMSRPLIYRYMKSLESLEILIVNRDVSPNIYIVNFESVVNALETSRFQVLSSLREEMNKISEQEIALTNVDLSWLARRFHIMLAGKPERVGTKTVKGIVDAHYLIDTEIYSKAIAGDTIRITLDWFQLTERSEVERQAGALQLAVKGVHIKSLQYFPEKVPPNIIKLRYERLKDLREKGVEAEFRIAPRTVRTYQGVALNREGFILVVSEEPLTLVWIPRSVNEALITEAINSYDRDFEKGTDFLEYYKEVYDESE